MSDKLMKDGAKTVGKIAFSYFMGSYGCCCIIWCFIPLTIISLVFFIFTIYSLFNDYTVAMECEEAHLWTFVV